MDKRKYRRVVSGVEIGFQVVEPDAASRAYFRGLVENYSFGGLFLATSEPLSSGDIVDLSIDVEGVAPFEARAVVRWVRRWGRPRGAGLEFVEFQNLGDRDVGEVLKELLEPDNGEGE